MAFSELRRDEVRHTGDGFFVVFDSPRDAIDCAVAIQRRLVDHRLEVTNAAAADTNGSGDIDSLAEIEAAIAAGHAQDLGVVKYFVCPVIPLPGG